MPSKFAYTLLCSTVLYRATNKDDFKVGKITEWAPANHQPTRVEDFKCCDQFICRRSFAVNVDGPGGGTARRVACQLLSYSVWHV